MEMEAIQLESLFMMAFGSNEVFRTHDGKFDIDKLSQLFLKK
jgi:hypothetical protein